MFTKFMKDNEYASAKKQEYYCSLCDMVVVNSDDKTTGQFYSISGHVYANAEAYLAVIFALCNDCMIAEVDPVVVDDSVRRDT